MKRLDRFSRRLDRFSETGPVSPMSVLVAYEREIGHPDADPHAERVDQIRRRLAQT